MFFSLNSYSFFELSGEYGLSKNTYGDGDQNNIETTSYSGTLAWYLTSTTAIELNYRSSKNKNTQTLPTLSTIYLSQIDAIVDSINYGIGIRQVLSNPKSRFRPLLSLGYSKQENTYENVYTIVNPADSTTTNEKSDPVKTTEDNVFVSLALQIRLSKRFSIKGSMTSFFPAFEFDQWDNDLRYTAGLSLFF